MTGRRKMASEETLRDERSTWHSCAIHPKRNVSSRTWCENSSREDIFHDVSGSKRQPAMDLWAVFQC